MIAREKECMYARRSINDGKLVNEMITSNVHALMVVESDQEVKFDQEMSTTDVKITADECECCDALIEESVREMQSTSSIMYGTTSEPGSAISTWTVEIVGHVVGRNQSSVADVRTLHLSFLVHFSRKVGIIVHCVRHCPFQRKYYRFT